MPQMTEAYQWHGRKVVDKAGEPVGKIEEIYEDQLTGEPEWALVNTGLFGSQPHLVPLTGASPDGGDVRVEVLKDQVHCAPAVDPDDQLSERQERLLFMHYGMRYVDPGTEIAAADEVPAPTATAADDQATPDVKVLAARQRRSVVKGDAGDAEIADQPVQPLPEPASNDRADGSITRSEEELRIGLKRRERGRVRLRKYVVTEEVTKTVPVRREVLRVEREPINEPSRPGALPQSDISEEEQEILLYEEEPIVEKRVVPKERVRLHTDVVEDQREISEKLRKERIETHTPDH